MTLEQWSALAEIVAAIAVVVSLVYLALQLRIGNIERKSAAIQSALDSEIDALGITLQNARIWDQVTAGAPLESGEETRKAILLYGVWMADTEKKYMAYKAGHLDSQSWEARLTGLTRVMSKLPIYDIWRSAPGAANRSAEVLELLDKLAGRISNE